MKKLTIFALIAGIAVYAYASNVGTLPGGMVNVTQTEVLVLASASTAVPTTPQSNRRAIEIYNNGPNAIYCKPGGTGAVGTTREILPDTSWYIEIGPQVAVGCRAATADQLTTAATVVTEIN